jgi:hypothetical protein
MARHFNTTGICFANPIYQELTPRALTSLMQVMLPQQSAWYLRAVAARSSGSSRWDRGGRTCFCATAGSGTPWS